MELPEELECVLQRHDCETAPYSEGTVYGALVEAQRGLDEDEKTGTPCLSEMMAFGFAENYRDERTGWGTYYGPMAVLNNGQGKWIESPSIKRVTSEVLEYWSCRARTAKHPLLRARYADLVWDFTKAVTGGDPEVAMAQIAIDANLAFVQSRQYNHVSNAITKLERSLSLALSTSDAPRVETARDAITAFEDELNTKDQSGPWCLGFDLLLSNKNVPLTAAQKERIIADLESRLQRAASDQIGNSLEPHIAQEVAMRLAQYYRSINAPNDVHRVLRLYGQAFVKASESVSPLVGSAWLQKVYEAYHTNGMKEDAAQLTERLRELGKKSRDELKPISHEVSIPADKMEAYCGQIAQGTLDEALARTAFHFLPCRDHLETQLKELAEDAPLYCLIPFSIQDSEGRAIAQIGPLQDDLDGRVVHQMAQNMHIEAIFLRKVLERVQVDHTPCLEEITDHMYKSPVFRPEYRDIVTAGVDAYMRGDYLTAAHLLVPQIENALRHLMTILGGPVYRPRRGGGLLLRTLDEVLRDHQVVKALGEDATLYLRVLLTDQRGWNLRNDVCHGVTRPDVFGWMMCDRLFHVCLLLAQLRIQPSAS